MPPIIISMSRPSPSSARVSCRACSAPPSSRAPVNALSISSSHLEAGRDKPAPRLVQRLSRDGLQHYPPAACEPDRILWTSFTYLLSTLRIPLLLKKPFSLEILNERHIIISLIIPKTKTIDDQDHNHGNAENHEDFPLPSSSLKSPQVSLSRPSIFCAPLACCGMTPPASVRVPEAGAADAAACCPMPFAATKPFSVRYMLTVALTSS